MLPTRGNHGALHGEGRGYDDDGTDDEKIKLEGLKGKYEFMHMDVDSAIGEVEELGEVEVCIEELGDDGIDDDEPEAPDHDIQEVDLAEEFDEVSNDAAELDLPDELPIIPDKFEARLDCPNVKDHKLMINSKIMMKWDCGWEVGTVKRRHTKGTEYNYFVQYKESNGSIVQYRHGLFAATYYNDETNEGGHWFMLDEAKDSADRD